MDETKNQPGRYDLFILIQAYNRGEISLEQWIEQTRAWAEAVLARASRQIPQPEPEGAG